MEAFKAFLAVDAGLWAIGVVGAVVLISNLDSIKRGLRNLWDVRD